MSELLSVQRGYKTVTDNTMDDVSDNSSDDSVSSYATAKEFID
jgi:hypothetical protein